ncbi:MAG: NADH-ubiquinone oxidoreductase-F iron-sulfur binding region domain-containing protein [Gaiellaceae bacterium]
MPETLGRTPEVGLPDPGPLDRLPRLLAGMHADGSPPPLEEHLDRYGSPLPDRRPRGWTEELIAVVEASGLRGCGGAGFPTARKLQAVASQRGRKIVVANGVEGELVSSKDKLLLRSAPQLVLDGAVIAAAAVGAEEAVIAVARSAREEAAAIAQAIEQRGRRLDGGVALRLVGVPDGFVAGEETALVQSLNGRPARPTFVPPRPFEKGVDGRPTLVQNVETLGQLALVARFGARWFRGLGTEREPGSALVTLGGSVRRAGVYEIGLGTTLGDLVRSAGGVAEEPGAFLVGGYFGAWIDPREAESLPLLDGTLAERGASLGARAIVALPRNACGLIETARVARYLARESAGQCGPCVNGLAAIAGALEQVARGGRDARAERLPRWLSQVAGRGACRHPDGAVRFVESALAVFSDEIERHVHQRRCSGRDRAILPVTGERRAR